MKKSEKKQLEKLQEEINKLPIRAQQTICWLIDNFNLCKKYAKIQRCLSKKSKNRKKSLEKKQDYMALALLCAVKVYKNKTSL